jgi:hypothetical protein
MTTVERECRSSWYADTGRTQNRGDREVRCSLEQGHGGDHEEWDDTGAGVLAEWPRRRVEPRTWSLPAEPGPEVRAIRCDCHGLWRRFNWPHGTVWLLERPIDVGMGPYCVGWRSLLGEHIAADQTLTDATGEQS